MNFLFILVHGFRNRFFLAYTAKEKRLIPTNLGTDLCYCILVVGSERPGSHGQKFLTFEPPWQHVQWVFLIVFKNSVRNYKALYEKRWNYEKCMNNYCRFSVGQNRALFNDILAPRWLKNSRQKLIPHLSLAKKY